MHAQARYTNTSLYPTWPCETIWEHRASSPFNNSSNWRKWVLKLHFQVLILSAWLEIRIHFLWDRGGGVGRGWGGSSVTSIRRSAVSSYSHSQPVTSLTGRENIFFFCPIEERLSNTWCVRFVHLQAPFSCEVSVLQMSCEWVNVFGLCASNGVTSSTMTAGAEWFQPAQCGERLAIIWAIRTQDGEHHGFGVFFKEKHYFGVRGAHPSHGSLCHTAAI